MCHPVLSYGQVALVNGRLQPGHHLDALLPLEEDACLPPQVVEAAACRVSTKGQGLLGGCSWDALPLHSLRPQLAQVHCEKQTGWLKNVTK